MTKAFGVSQPGMRRRRTAKLSAWVDPSVEVQKFYVGQPCQPSVHFRGMARDFASSAVQCLLRAIVEGLSSEATEPSRTEKSPRVKAASGTWHSFCFSARAYRSALREAVSVVTTKTNPAMKANLAALLPLWVPLLGPTGNDIHALACSFLPLA